MPIPTAEERLGTKIAQKYRLDAILGRGGFGVVYAGVHEWTGREIAVKLLSHDFGQQPSAVKRFLQEARTAAMLKHPNVVDVLDMGQDEDGSVYLVLELLEGYELTKELAKSGALSLDRTMEILEPIMDALADAHDRAIVHRDIKPDNIFLSVGTKGRFVPKLLDFGIAKMADGTGHNTTMGMVVGTPHFMSPEQARGRGDLGPPADVWSMAVVVWHCLSGKLPFDSDTPTGVIAEILTQRAPSISRVVPGLSPGVAAVLDRALEPNVAERYPNMRAFAAALEHARTGPIPETAASPPAVVAEAAASRRRIAVIGAGIATLAVLAALSGVAAFALSGGDEGRATRRTATEPMEEPPTDLVSLETAEPPVEPSDPSGPVEEASTSTAAPIEVVEAPEPAAREAPSAGERLSVARRQPAPTRVAIPSPQPLAPPPAVRTVRRQQFGTNGAIIPD